MGFIVDVSCESRNCVVLCLKCCIYFFCFVFWLGRVSMCSSDWISKF